MQSSQKMELRSSVIKAHKDNDLATHKRDGYGKIAEIRPYRLHIQGQTQAFEFPVGSGNLWNIEDNKFKHPAGRIVAGKIDSTATHIEWTAPVTGDAKLSKQVADTSSRNAELQAELEAIKAEKLALEKSLAALNATTESNKQGVKK